MTRIVLNVMPHVHVPVFIYGSNVSLLPCTLPYFLGEKLSKQELQSNNVIKKLRSREKENERTVASQK